MKRPAAANTRFVSQEKLFPNQYDYIGIGQIVGQNYKAACIDDRGEEKGEVGAGFAERYKIRLCHKNSPETSDDILVNALRETDFPSGQCALDVYIPLAPNTFVNIHRNKKSQQYFITSVISNPNSVFNPDNMSVEGRCTPKSGFVPGLNWIQVPEGNIGYNARNAGIASTQRGSAVVNEKAAGMLAEFSNLDKIQDRDKVTFNVPVACEPFNPGAVQKDVQNFIKSIENIREDLGDGQESIQKIQKELREVSKDIAKHIKWLIQQIKRQTEKQINFVANQITQRIPYANQRFLGRNAKEIAQDQVACMFNRIIDNLVNWISDWLNNVIDTYINVPLCIIESFLADLIGGLLNQIIAELSGILSSVSGVLGAAIDVADTILDIVESILDFLNCNQDNVCPEVTEWSILDGVETPPRPRIDFNQLFQDIRSVAESGESLIDDVTDAAGNIGDTVVNFGTSINNIVASCQVGPVACGPPDVIFWGGGGTGGASGNVIISGIGDILGVDIILPGFYEETPFVAFQDPCGRGRGGTGTVILNEDGGVQEVVMNEPGVGYTGRSDGSTGGDGRTWSDPDDTIVIRPPGRYDPPHRPEDVVDVEPGDIVIYPGGNDPITIGTTTTITCPPYPTGDDVDRDDRDDEYDIVLGIGTVVVDDGGFGYDCGVDEIVITPSNGAELSFECRDGRIRSVNVVDPGYGFVEYPDISIKTNTGYNARLIPSFRRVETAELPSQDKIVQVVDCVGKFS